MTELLRAIHDKNWGDFASIAGVVISLVGFAFTLFGLARSKSAAKKVADAVAQVRTAITLKEVAQHWLVSPPRRSTLHWQYGYRQATVRAEG